MKCPICIEPFIDAVRSPCFHIFCRRCITTWLETETTCPMCRGNPHPMIAMEWETFDSTLESSENFGNSEESGNSGNSVNGAPKIVDVRGLILQELATMMPSTEFKPGKSQAEENFKRAVEPIETRKANFLLQQQIKYEEFLLQQQRRYEEFLKQQEVYKQEHDKIIAHSMSCIHEQYQRELTAEAVITKQEEARLEHIRLISDTCKSLSVQRSEVLDQHFDLYHSKAQRLCYGFLDMTSEEPSQPWSPEIKPLAYIKNTNKLLVGDGNKLWIFGESDKKLHYFSVACGKTHLYIIRRKSYMICNFSLRLLETITIESIISGKGWVFQGMTDDGFPLISNTKRHGGQVDMIQGIGEIRKDIQYIVVPWNYMPMGGYAGLQFLCAYGDEYYRGTRFSGRTRLVITDSEGPSICQSTKDGKSLVWRDKIYKVSDHEVKNFRFLSGPMVGDVPTVLVKSESKLTTIFLD